ncbi:MAG: hypothetical protein HYY49_07610 [Ignavibacteriales bacterium]|nr:hypothetical protein [Ignavibacteriales bacterium]
MADEDITSQEGDEESNRKLAAIMFTDIKAFSKKMGKDEKAAMEILKTHDAMMRVFVAKHGGKVIKVIGDSFMVDFASAVNAVKCAIKAQEYFYKYNEDKNDFERIEIRIGIHLGDVVVVGNDMYGDGVNIASRIEAITEPTRICITADVYSQVKKKMDLKVYHMGSMELKNIEEPVEVYEILFDSIPAFSQPSERAKKAPSKRKVEAVTQEEAEEAKAIEAKKQKAAGADQMSEEVKTRLIEEHYRKAERFYEKGEFEKAEAEINEIYRIDPNRAEVEKRLAEEEQKQEMVEGFYKKAEEYFNQNDFDEAEKHANEIFKIVPLHARGQALLGKIEDKRYEQKEKQRREEDAKRRSEDERRERTEGGIRRAKQFMDQFKYREALQEVEEVLSIDAENIAGNELKGILEEKVQKEEAEVVVKEVEEAPKVVEGRKKEKDAAQLARELAEQQAAAAAAAAAAEEAERRRRRAAMIKVLVRYGTRVAAVIGAAALLYFGVPIAFRAMFPNSASIAVVSFGGSGAEENYLAGMLPEFIAKDLTGHAHVSVVSPSSSVRYSAGVDDLAKIGRELNVKQVITGEVQTNGQNFALVVRMYDIEKKSKPLEEKFENTISSLPDVRSAVVRRVLEVMEIDAEPRKVTSPTKNAFAYDRYLRGSWLVSQKNLDDVQRGVALLQSVVLEEPSFSLAQATLAEGLIRQFRVGGEANRTLLAEAIDAARKAAETDRTNAEAFLRIGMASRYLRRFEDAKRNVNRSLSLQAVNPDAHRELSLLSLVEGDLEKAADHLAEAKSIDPRNPDTYFVAGLIHHFRQQYGEAANAYQAAIDLGANEFVVTSRFLSKVWDAQVQESKTVAFFRKILERNARDFATYYRIGQAFQVTGKVEDAKKFLEPGEKVAREAADANPRDGRAHVYRALFLSRLGDPTGDWEKELKTASDLASSDAEVFYRTANAYAIWNKKPEALAALKRALELDYSYAEILNADFNLLSRDPEFQAVVVRKIKEADLE